MSIQAVIKWQHSYFIPYPKGFFKKSKIMLKILIAYTELPAKFSLAGPVSKETAGPTKKSRR